MTLEETHARHLVELGFLQEVLVELGYATHLVERSEQAPYHTLLVNLEPDELGRPRQLALNFYPVDEALIANSLLLQYYLLLPVALNAAGARRVREWLPEINSQTVLGHFGLDAEAQRLHFRYVQALPRDEVITAEAVEDVLTLVTYSPLLYAAALEGLANGSLRLAEARAQVQARLGQT